MSRQNAYTGPIPTASPEWKPQARSWFNSLRLSGQSKYYEASDWATAVAAAQAYDIFLRTHSPGILSQFVRLSERLGATITDRRRSGIEMDEPEHTDADEEAADKAVTDWQLRLVK
jgi:hypothetical protein